MIFGELGSAPRVNFLFLVPLVVFRGQVLFVFTGLNGKLWLYGQNMLRHGDLPWAKAHKLQRPPWELEI